VSDYANNANASISRSHFNDNLLNSETETVTSGVAPRKLFRNCFSSPSQSAGVNG
jgi:hypothetical protein